MKYVLIFILLLSFRAVSNTASISLAVGHDHHKMLQQYRFYAASWEILTKELTALGYQVNVKAYPWARAKDKVENTTHDGLFLAANFRGREQWAVLSRAIGQDHFGIFNHRQSDNSKPIGSVRFSGNYSQISFLAKDKQVKFATAQDGLKLLANKKLSGFIMSRSYGEYLLANELKQIRNRIIFNDTRFEIHTAHIAISKKHPNVNVIQSLINSAIENAIESGRYFQVMKKHDVDDYQLIK